jgi:pimeloyl-ACP methyl ester carboxylesterase
MKLNYQRVGAGQTMLLIHGTGSHLQTWKPLLPALAADYDIFAVDLPGFGDSPPLPEIDLPTPARLAELLAAFLDEHGVEAAHVVGNSTGGTIGFELAKLGRARSVTAFSPMGLWADGIPLRLRYSLSLLRQFARAIRPFYDAFAGPWRRTPIMISMYGRPWLLPDDVSRAAVVNLANSPGYSAAIRGLLAARRFEGGKDLDVPITVAFGARDLGLREKECRRNAELPLHTQWMTLRGCGHVPMFDDPELVVRVILECAGRNPKGKTDRRPTIRRTK